MLYMHFFCASVSKMCPKGSEKTERLAVGSGNAKKFSIKINGHYVFALDNFSLRTISQENSTFS